MLCSRCPQGQVGRDGRVDSGAAPGSGGLGYRSRPTRAARRPTVGARQRRGARFRGVAESRRMKSSPSNPSARRSKAAVRARRRRMPAGIRIFLVYGFLILADHRPVAALGRRPGGGRCRSARSASWSMVLLAYTIFTMTLVFQRKEAARGLALGLASLTLPAIPAGLAVVHPDRAADRGDALRPRLGPPPVPGTAGARGSRPTWTSPEPAAQPRRPVGTLGCSGDRHAALGSRCRLLPDLPRPVRRQRPRAQARSPRAVGRSADPPRLQGRRPAGDRRAPADAGRPGDHRPLPDPDLRLGLEPPLSHVRLPAGRSAARRRRGPARAGRRGPRPGDADRPRRRLQPHRAWLLGLPPHPRERPRLALPRLVPGGSRRRWPRAGSCSPIPTPAGP